MARRNGEAELDLAARVARLTAGQRACLELVDDHATSKEIALRLGISRHTVDARLRQAMQILDVTSRREAAVIWRTASGTDGYQPFAYQPPHIAMLPDRAADGASRTEPHHDADQQDDRRGIGGSDAPAHSLPPASRPIHIPPEREQAAMEVADTAPEQWAWSADAPEIRAPSSTIRLWGGANDLTPPQRLVGILVVALLGMLAFGLLLSGIEALTTLRA